ncbi:MAG TPA: hypothetical protein VGE08_04210 [Steroidobacter sp.]|uniref:hypothetical protein n=1 Tax=Steroidobacter sp. TaxID=1978227 RepID=UPI002ED8A332
MSRKCVTSAALVWLALTIGLPAVAATEPAPAEATATAADPVQAIWKHQEISFYFQSFTTFYSCTGLESKLERIMRELGVHARVKVRSADCPASVARMPRVVMNVVAPVEATPEALAERDKNKSVRELVERVRGKSNHRLDSLEQFPAQWRRVSLTRGRLDLQPGDCELIEEVKKKVLPKLAVRIVNDDVQCSPNQLTLGQPRLEVEALVELPQPDDKAEDAAASKQQGT